jgi:hypothetical protein
VALHKLFENSSIRSGCFSILSCSVTTPSSSTLAARATNKSDLEGVLRTGFESDWKKADN